MVGLAIAEVFAAADGTQQSELLSLHVASTYTAQEQAPIRTSLLNHLAQRTDHAIR